MMLCVTEGAEGVRWVTQALAEAMLDFSPSSETNPQCNLHSALYRQGLANSTLWAVQSKCTNLQLVSYIYRVRTHPNLC